MKPKNLKIMKKWYYKEFIKWTFSTEKEVCSFLNELNYNGISPENIKIAGHDNSYTVVYYYSDKEVK